MTHATPNQEGWDAPPAAAALGEGEVHVWRASLKGDASGVEALREILDAGERERADRYHFERDRERFVIARGVLRKLLARYLLRAPGQIEFTYSPYGKPAVAVAPDGLSFNVSHSHEVALYAFTRGREVGLDVEFIREDFAGMEVAERFFSAREVAALRRLPPDSRTRAFFNCWTRKEAYIKARGEGLSHPLERFSVSLAPGEPAALLSAEDDPPEVTRWSLHELRPGPGYVAALALRGAPRRISLWQWPG